jgi:hypothetical protein
MTIDSLTLLPCPFCGYQPPDAEELICMMSTEDDDGEWDGRYRLTGVCCANCAVFLPLDDVPRDDAIAAWNKRDVSQGPRSGYSQTTEVREITVEWCANEIEVLAQRLIDSCNASFESGDQGSAIIERFQAEGARAAAAHIRKMTQPA